MNLVVKTVFAAITSVCVQGQALLALQAPPARFKVCGLLPKDQVKKLIGGNQLFDQFPPEEESLGQTGSSCNYAGVMVQVLVFSQSTFDFAKKRGRLEPVTGVGDEAYLYDNPAGYAELYVKVGKNMLTIQRDVNSPATVASVRPGVIALANAIVPKLR